MKNQLATYFWIAVLLAAGAVFYGGIFYAGMRYERRKFKELIRERDPKPASMLKLLGGE